MMESTFILKGSAKNLILVNIFAVIAGVGMLFLIYKVGIHYGLGFFIVGSFILIGWMFTDALVWHYRGVHELHINVKGVNVVRGFKRKTVFITPDQITDIFVYKKGFRKNLNIMLQNKVVQVPGIITLYPGKRVQLFSDAFSDREFDRAVELLQQLHLVKSNDLN